jgi:hypothetical protein
VEEGFGAGEASWVAAVLAFEARSEHQHLHSQKQK